MFPQFGATADSLSKASTMVFRMGTDAHLYDDPDDVNISPLLDSKFDSEKCEALKRLLALIAQGLDVSNFFPQVVKNVASQSLDVKKLAYLYLLHYAEKRPNEALLSINCFQKDLGDTNPLVRAWALRTMAGIRLHAIAHLVLVAVQKCARDPSVYVRKCAAGALPKLHDLRLDENTSAIEEIIGTLLNDQSPAVVGAAASAFASVCPNNLSLIGSYYKRLCEILPDVEEWGQIVLIGVLLRYAIGRYGLMKESVMFSLHKKESPNPEIDINGVASEEEIDDECVSLDCKIANMVARCYIEGPDEYLSRLSYTNMDASESFRPLFTSGKNNEDVKILLQCTSPLLWSNNSAVVLAAAGVHWIMAPKKDVKNIVKPLLFLLRSSYASKYVVLSNIQVIAKAIPSLFGPHFEDFFVSSSDSHQVKALKLQILSCIATDSSSSSIFREFQDYVRDPDRRFAAEAVNAIGLCACRLPKVANMWLNGLLVLTRQEIHSNDIVSVEEEAVVLTQALLSIKSIVKQDPPGHEKAVIQLIRCLDSIKVSAARAILIWMVGEYNSLGDVIPRMLTTLLKYLAHCFTTEALEAKLQILNTTVKVLLHAKGEDLWTARKVLSYLLELAECDLNYDVRDRARFLRKVLSCKLESQGHEEDVEDLQHKLAEHILSGEVRSVPFQPMNNRFYLPGSLSQLVLHAAPGYEPLPKPCSLAISEPDLGKGTDTLSEDTNSGSYDTDDHGSLSESFDEESDAEYSSQGTYTGSADDGEGNGSACETGDGANKLIQLSDNDLADQNSNGVPESGIPDMGEFMTKGALESWLGEQSGISNASSSGHQFLKSTARISLGNIVGRVKPKKFTLLEPVNGNGLKVDYMFSSEISNVSPSLVCIEVFFENCSSEPLMEIELANGESDKGLNSADSALSQNESSQAYNNEAPTTVPLEKIVSLQPGHTTQKTLQVRFHHHLLPLKLVLTCSGEVYPVKLWPDIGYFVKPLPMDIATYTEKESTLRGMFEYTRRCTFTDHLREVNKKGGDLQTSDSFLIICESLALKMLSNANIFLVSVDLPVASNFDDASGLCLRFSSEILSNSMPCLITITCEGNCSEQLNASVKINCEDTVFGLNFLNRVVSFLVEPSPTEL